MIDLPPPPPFALAVLIFAPFGVVYALFAIWLGVAAAREDDWLAAFVAAWLSAICIAVTAWAFGLI